MPKGLDELYKVTLERIQKQAGNDGALGMRVLSWITHARRPFSVDELRYGLAVECSDNGEDLEEFDEDNLLSPGSLVDVCAGLVIIDSNSRTVRLVHYTTQEYFDKAGIQLFRDAEVDMSRACLTCLSFSSSTELERCSEPVLSPFERRIMLKDISRTQPFLMYAIGFWFSHVKSGLLLQNPHLTFLRVVARFKKSDTILYASEIYRSLLVPNRRTSVFSDPHRFSETYPCEVASALGLEEFVTFCLDSGTGACPNLDSSLCYASCNDHLEIVKLLRQNGASINSTFNPRGSGDKTFSALEGACYVGCLSVAEFLIDNGANLSGGSPSFCPPLHAAARNSRARIIDLLLKQGVDVDARDFSGQTACHVAASRGKLVSMRCLLDAGCKLELLDDDGRTVLLCCSKSLFSPTGNVITSMNVIKLLVDKDADVTAKNKKGETLRNIIENELKYGCRYVPGYSRGDIKRLVKMLRQAEQKSSASATKNSQSNIPSSSGQSLTPA